jgi:hypothetical protein
MFLYGVAAFFGFVALAVLLLPILVSLQDLRNGLTGLVVAGVAVRTAPFALSLAVVPLCIAFAYDRMTG